LNKRKQKTEEKLKGDKLRDLILLVYLNNKYGKGSNDIASLREILGYSVGGIYNALDYSGYFKRRPERIELTEKGQEYLKKKILAQYDLINSVSNIFIIMGFVFLIQWIYWNYAHYAMILPWHSVLITFGIGIFIRFFTLRINYWIIRRRKEMV
jgi:DNA-binding MarR family transcriptional regulator